MMNLLVYEAKVAAALLVFYLFYRFLLKKETFHRFNRAVLVGTTVLSFLLPLCIITIHRPMKSGAMAPEPAAGMPVPQGLIAEAAAPWWPTALGLLFWAGVAFALVRIAVSTLSIAKIIRQGEVIREEDGCRIILTDREIDPFSWMRYIVLSRKDWEDKRAPILTHEKAHVRMGHSLELLLVDALAAFQWFNPAIWMLRSDLQELHEYEADDAVLRAGIDIRDYQYLLIRKAVGKSGYSVANSFNHSILKNRITMMSKTKSPLSRGLRVLWLLPLVFIGLCLQARTVYEPVSQVRAVLISPEGAAPIYILHLPWGEEKEISKEEFYSIEPTEIQSVEVVKGEVAKEKYGKRGKNGAIVITRKTPQQMNPVVIVSKDEDDDDELIPFYLYNPDSMPSFNGEGMDGFSKWLNSQIRRPKGCKHKGTMKVSFVVTEDGTVENVKVTENICEELDALVVECISKSPRWEPAMANGRPVGQGLTLPIVFQIR